jgi:tRNA(Ile)-lysidine synthase
VDDPSNADIAFTRNRIRRVVMPALEQAFPQFRDTFARSARHAAQAQELLDEVAAQDLRGMDGLPRITSLQALSRPRQANVLRHWLRSVHAQTPSAAQMDELLDQVAACATRGHAIRLKVAGGYVTRDGPTLQFTGS